MKRIFLNLLFSASVCFLHGAPVNNPMNPEIIEEGFFITPASWLNFRIGYEGNFISDGRMEKKTGTEGKVDNFEQDVNSGSFTLNMQSRLDIFTVLGASRIKTDWRFKESSISRRIELETNYRFSWVIGARAILFEWGNTALGVGGRYSKTKPSLSWLTKDGVPQEVGRPKVSYKDWQADMGLSHRIDIFIPYIGVKYSNTRAKLRNMGLIVASDNSMFMHMRNRDHFGVYAGCSLSNAKYFLFNVEARLIDEEAITVSGEIKF